MNRMKLVVPALAGLVALTGLAGAIIFAFTLDEPSSGAPSAEPSYSGAPTPSELVGTWSSSRLSSISYRDRYTGSYAPPSGSIFSYKIAANGTYEYSGLMQSSLYSCTITVFGWQRGTLSVNGDRLSLKSREGKLSYKDTCRRSTDSEKTKIDEPTTYTFKIETEDNHQVLVMKKANGEDWGKFYRR